MPPNKELTLDEVQTIKSSHNHPLWLCCTKSKDKEEKQWHLVKYDSHYYILPFCEDCIGPYSNWKLFIYRPLTEKELFVYNII